VLASYQIALAVAAALALAAAAYRLVMGGERGMPGLWMSTSEGSSWTVKPQKLHAESLIAAPALAPRPDTQRLRLEIDAPAEARGGGAQGGAQRLAPRMYRSVAEQERAERGALL
jgi:hypothetical protein